MPHAIAYKRAGQEDLSALTAFDREVFPPGDIFTVEDYSHFLSWWIYLGAERVGAMALAPDRGLWLEGQSEPPASPGTLYIASTGIIPSRQRQGIGSQVKGDQISFARNLCQERIVTCCRVGNVASRRLNEKFGFSVIDTLPGFYRDPPDDAFVLELRFDPPRHH